MSLSTVLIGISAAVIILFSIVTSHIERRLIRLENRLESIANDIKYNQYLINTQDTDNTNDKDIRVVIYSNDKEVYEWRD